VNFNGTCAPIVYTSANQVAAITPYEVSGVQAQITLNYMGQTSASFSAMLAPTVPGIFTSNSSGIGEAAALNQDQSINATANPAHVGDIITVFATGEGQTTPAGMDGKPAASPYPSPNLPVTVMVGGVAVSPIYAGAAPGEVAGVMQVDVQIPAGIQTSASVAITLQVANVPSQPGVTVAVQ